MKRRTFVKAGLATLFGRHVLGALTQQRLEEAAKVLSQAVGDGQVAAAVLYARQREAVFSRSFGKAANDEAMFLLGSISKPINMTALMTLFDQGRFQLDDPVKKYLPKFTGEGRDDVTLKQLLTHTSGLPDQLANNDELRRKHAPLLEFVDATMRTPLSFAPGSRYQYSSMGILLASRIAELLSDSNILTLTERAVIRPLGLKRTAQGLGGFQMSDLVAMQTDRAAPESGGGDPTAKDWDWNSPYWRQLGAPWGGTHASAPDIATWLSEFLEAKGQVVKPETARLMTMNHNPAGFTSRGLGFVVGGGLGGQGTSDRTFGHTGSTGTIAWADPATQTICVVLTSLPARAVTPHPRDTVSKLVASAAR